MKVLLRAPGMFLAIVLMLVASSSAQEQSEADRILRVVLTHLRHAVRDGGTTTAGKVGFDPRPVQVRLTPGLELRPLPPLGPPAWGEERSPGQFAAITRDIATASRFDTALVCPPRGRRCELRGAALVIAASEPIIDGGRARVFVWERHRSAAAREGVVEALLEISLVRAGDGWKVAGTRYILVT